MSEQLYRQQILEHYRQPRHYGRHRGATHRLTGANLSCGDELTIFLTVKRGLIEQATFESRACAICTASASLLLEQIQGVKVSEVLALNRHKIEENLNIPLSPVRLKCALLPLTTIKDLKKVSPTAAPKQADQS